MYCTVFLVQLVMREGGKGPVEKYCMVLNVKSADANMNDLQASQIFKTIKLRYILVNVNICCDTMLTALRYQQAGA